MPKIKKKIKAALNLQGYKVVSSHLTAKHTLKAVGVACDKLIDPKAVPVNELERQVLRELVSMGLAERERLGYKLIPND